jgi:hypothetical protein
MKIEVFFFGMGSMEKGKGSFEPKGLTIDYKGLGTISIDELAHAIVADIQALKDIYNIQYVRAPRLRLYATNEYGERVTFRRPAGGTIRYMDTHHFRPSCKDYDL